MPSPRLVVSGPVARRLVLVDEVIVSTPLDPLLSLKALAAYTSLSVRTLRDALRDPTHPLPCYRIGGKIVVRRSHFDAWAERFHTRAAPVDVASVAADALQALARPRGP
jgi:Helix-turn-helix domain